MCAAITEPRAARVHAVRGLYAVTPDTVDTPWLVAAVQSAVRGGARVVQYRNKTADAVLRRAQAAALATALAGTSARYIVNDDPELARSVRAHGVHLGEDDGDVARARALLGREALIGVSCYDDPERAKELVRAGADYVAFGSFFPSGVKPGARRASTALLREAAGLGVPVVAIGGITAANAASLRDAGADAVAVISAVFGAPDAASIERAARSIAALFVPDEPDR